MDMTDTTRNNTHTHTHTLYHQQDIAWTTTPRTTL